ncbi:MAG: hypothetical protein QGG14_06195 [Planctomycetota bacterium]|jgi:hypothetical protein|nr:hypothetical protein [Planctomycetota bacterium]
MAKALEFIPDPDGRTCDRCGSLMGTIDGQEVKPSNNGWDADRKLPVL